MSELNRKKVNDRITEIVRGHLSDIGVLSGMQDRLVRDLQEHMDATVEAALTEEAES